MAVFCRECQRVFSHSPINCPFCGNPPQSDSRTVQELTASGYRLVAPKRQPDGSAAPGQEKQSFSGRSEALERLRRAYRIDDAHTQTHAASSGGGTDIPTAPRPGREADSLDDWLYGRSSPEGTQAPYRTAPPEPAPEPPAAHPNAPSEPPPAYEDQELRRLRRSQRLYHFRSRASSLFRSIALWPWRWIFRILLVIAVILLVRAFIAALPAILNGALNLILSLLPAILVIAIIVWLLRHIFRP